MNERVRFVSYPWFAYRRGLHLLEKEKAMSGNMESIIIEINGIQVNASLAVKLLNEREMMDYLDHERAEIEKRRSFFKKLYKDSRKPAKVLV